MNPKRGSKTQDIALSGLLFALAWLSLLWRARWSSPG